MVTVMDHNQKFCSVKKRAIYKPDQIYNAACPHCGVSLPAKGRAVRVQVDDDGEILSSAPVPLPPIWKRPLVIVAVVAFVGHTLMSLAGGNGSTEPSIQTQSAVAIVNSDLLGGGNFTGSGSYAVVQARKAYNSSLDATAVAAKVSIPGVDDLCLFWYVGGRKLSDGLTIGDSLTREFSVWGADVARGTTADGWVKELKSSPEGRAVVRVVGC